MVVLDWIELSDDDEPMVKQEQDAHVPCHAAQLEVETVDLTLEEDVVEEDKNAHFVLPKQEFLEAGHGVEEAMQPPGNQDFPVAVDCAQEAMHSGNQYFVAAIDCAQEAMQPGNQDFVAAGGVEKVAMHPGNQVFVAAVDCAQEAMQSGNQDFVAAADCAEQAMQPESTHGDVPSSSTEQGIAAGDCAEEAMQSKHADEVAASSPLTEQDEHQIHKADALLGSPPISTAAPFLRQFWKAGEYKVAAQASITNGQNCLRIHPKFLHSNATSHKWSFGAIAELLDNAVDEVRNGATYVKIDKMKYSPVGEYSLVIQDDGGGMSPEYLRHCLSFGFSNKCTNSSIGQYGNGFKTSTMRLGADAIIFSCTQDKRRLTRSVGLLSYTFLTRTGCNDILVPVVDYEFDPSSCTSERIMDRGEKHFSSNLSTLLRWSPFSSEDDLLNQFGDMGHHGTKIVVYNLWFNDAWEMELDFATDDEDVMISGAPKIPEEHSKVKRLNHMHVANRFRYSLRVYASILYLHLPEHFKVILCGRVVEPHRIVNDLIYCECIKYRPQVGTSVQADVLTTIGFLKGAPNLDIYGFNIYHRNRLILPFWSAGSERGHGRGIAGVLEANFIRPTHDKQDFEKTELFQRLDTRLKDMTTEYWKYHAELIGYRNHINRPRAKTSVVLNPRYNEANSLNHLHAGVSKDQMDYGACTSTRRNMRTSFCMPRIPQQTEPCKRRNPGFVIESRAQKRQNMNDDPGSINVVQMGEERSRVLIYQNQMLKAECTQLEAAGQQLLSKADKLSNELHMFQRLLKSLGDELRFYDGLSALQQRIPTANMGVGWI